MKDDAKAYPSSGSAQMVDKMTPVESIKTALTSADRLAHQVQLFLDDLIGATGPFDGDTCADEADLPVFPQLDIRAQTVLRDTQNSLERISIAREVLGI